MAAEHGDGRRALTPPPSSTRRCPGPRCARSTASSAWPRSGGRARRRGVSPGPRRRGHRREPRLRACSSAPERTPRQTSASAPSSSRAASPVTPPSSRDRWPDERPGPDASPPSSRSSCAGSSSAGSSTPCPSAWPSPAPTSSAHIEFLEQLFSDEVQRRDAESAGLRAHTAHLDPAMTLERLGRDGQGHLRPRRVVRAGDAALRRAVGQRLHPGAGRRGQDLLGHGPRPHRLPAAGQRALRARRPAPQAPEGLPPRPELRPRDAQADRRRPVDRRRLLPPAPRRHRDRRPLRPRASSATTAPRPSSPRTATRASGWPSWPTRCSPSRPSTG